MLAGRASQAVGNWAHGCVVREMWGSDAGEREAQGEMREITREAVEMLQDAVVAKLMVWDSLTALERELGCEVREELVAQMAAAGDDWSDTGRVREWLEEWLKEDDDDERE